MQAKLEVKNESELNDFMTSNVATTNHNNTNITDKKVNIQESQSVESSKTSKSKPATINCWTELINRAKKRRRY